MLAVVDYENSVGAFLDGGKVVEFAQFIIGITRNRFTCYCVIRKTNKKI